MTFMIKAFLILSLYILLSFTSNVDAMQGNAVFYKRPYEPSKCFGNQKKGVMIAGVSDALWNNGAACGRRYRVKCIGGANEAPHPCKYGRSVVVTVVDYCQSKCNGILNLSQDAFNIIADSDAGIVRVDFSPA